MHLTPVAFLTEKNIAVVRRRLSVRECQEAGIESVIFEACLRLDRAISKGWRLGQIDLGFSLMLKRTVIDYQRAFTRRRVREMGHAAAEPTHARCGDALTELVEECEHGLRGEPQRVRRVFRIVLIEGSTLSEAAIQIGCSVSQASYDLQRARLTVQAALNRRR